MLRRLSLALYTAMLLIGGLSLGATASSASGGGSAPQLPPTSLLTTIENGDGRPTLDWSLRGSSDRINVLPNLRCALGPEGSHDQFPATDPCLWLVDHLAPVPDSITPGCVPSREPDSGGPATYASWRCDMRAFQDLVIHAAQNANDRSFVMFNAPSTGGSGICARIPITVLLGHGSGELQAADGCPQTIRCEADYAGTVRSDALDTVSGCGGGSGGSGGGPGGSGGGSGSGGGGSVPPAPGSGSKKPSSGGGASTAKGSACPGASSGKKGNSPLYSVYIKAVGKRGMKIYVHMRRAVPITVDVRMRRSNGTKVVRWVSRCAKKGKNVISFPNATGGAKNRRNYRVYVKSPNSTYPLRSSWEALPRR